MARTPSNMLALGTKAPSFNLLDTKTQILTTWKDISGTNGTVVMFICNHCPFVKHVFKGMVSLARDYQSKGIGFVAISSNDIENYPEDAPDLMKVIAEKEGFNFPYLYDESQEIARAYEAACTPDFYIFDKDDLLIYRGQLDGSRPENGIPVTGKDMRNALDAHLNGVQIDVLQKPSIGCNIKWKNSGTIVK